MQRSLCTESSSSSRIALYSYWQSSCSWRVRFALKLKGLKLTIGGVNKCSDGYSTLVASGVWLQDLVLSIRVLILRKGRIWPQVRFEWVKFCLCNDVVGYILQSGLEILDLRFRVCRIWGVESSSLCACVGWWEFGGSGLVCDHTGKWFFFS